MFILITHILQPMEILARAKRQVTEIKGKQIWKTEIKLPLFPASMNLCIKTHKESTKILDNYKMCLAKLQGQCKKLNHNSP